MQTWWQRTVSAKELAAALGIVTAQQLGLLGWMVWHWWGHTQAAVIWTVAVLMFLVLKLRRWAGK